MVTGPNGQHVHATVYPVVTVTVMGLSCPNGLHVHVTVPMTQSYLGSRNLKGSAGYCLLTVAISSWYLHDKLGNELGHRKLSTDGIVYDL